MKPAFDIHRNAIDKLLTYSFPGNVRELQYVIERAVIMADDYILQAKDFLFSPIEQAANLPEVNETNLGDLEKSTILRVIDKNNGNITKAAKELGLTRTALYRRLSKYDI
jgi:transcriptional regulator of acetoin/glycerol metabolism